MLVQKPAKTNHENPNPKDAIKRVEDLLMMERLHGVIGMVTVMVMVRIQVRVKVSLEDVVRFRLRVHLVTIYVRIKSVTTDSCLIDLSARETVIISISLVIEGVRAQILCLIPTKLDANCDLE